MSTKLVHELVHETPTNSNAQINMATAMIKKQRPAMVTKEMLYPSVFGHGPQTVLLWKQESTRQRGLHDSPA
jgi:hypothetical protein